MGRITRVEAGYSWAELITSSSLLIPVVVDQTRILVVTGDGQDRSGCSIFRKADP